MPQQPSHHADLATLENETLAREAWGPLNAYAGLTRACHRKACREGEGCTRGLTCWAEQPRQALIFMLYHWATLDMSFGEVVALGVERARDAAGGQEPAPRPAKRAPPSP